MKTEYEYIHFLEMSVPVQRKQWSSSGHMARLVDLSAKQRICTDPASP
jgi:hypothetical protein